MTKVEDAVRDVFISNNENDRNLEPANVVDGLFAIARSIEYLGYQVKMLGNGDAATPMGAIEAFGKIFGEKMDAVVDILDSSGR